MHEYTLAHLSDAVLLRDLKTLVRQDRATTVMLLAHIAEVDARRLYAPAGYSSMFAYCTGELRLSEDAAYKRIRAARAARRFPVLFAELAEGRLHMAAVCVLSPHLTAENLEELAQAAKHRRKSEVEEWLIHRFPGAVVASKDCASVIRPILTGVSPTGSTDQLVLGPVPDGSKAAPEPPTIRSYVDQLPGPAAATHEERLAPIPLVDQLVPGPVGDTLNNRLPAGTLSVESPFATPSGKRFLVRLTIDEATHEKLRHAQALLSHAVPGGDVAQVLARALDALIVQLERRKIGATPRVAVVGEGGLAAPARTMSSRTPSKQHSERDRHIPVRVRRAVWERDQGRCTFVGTNGHRCDARRFLEFDHIEPLARGGKPTGAGLRLRCRSHNQFEAEQIFGAEFMKRKREEALRAGTKARPEMVREPAGFWAISSPRGGVASASG